MQEFDSHARARGSRGRKSRSALIIPRHAVFAAVDGWIEIDEMGARMAAGDEIDRHIAIATEAAGITDHGVVVSNRQGIINSSLR